MGLHNHLIHFLLNTWFSAKTCWSVSMFLQRFLGGPYAFSLGHSQKYTTHCARTHCILKSWRPTWPSTLVKVAITYPVETSKAPPCCSHTHSSPFMLFPPIMTRSTELLWPNKARAPPHKLSFPYMWQVCAHNFIALQHVRYPTYHHPT